MTGERTSETTRLLAEAFPVSTPELPGVFVAVGPYREIHAPRRTSLDRDERIAELRELNDALAAKVAHWKARAEAAEAALKAAEDDRHLTTPCA